MGGEYAKAWPVTRIRIIWNAKPRMLNVPAYQEERMTAGVPRGAKIKAATATTAVNPMASTNASGIRRSKRSIETDAKLRDRFAAAVFCVLKVPSSCAAALGPQPRDCIRVQTRCRKHLVGMLAEQRRRPLPHAGRRGQPRHDVVHGKRSKLRIFHIDQNFPRPKMRVCHRI